MICCRVLGVRLWYRDSDGSLHEDLERAVWSHREGEKTQELVLLGDFRGRKRKDVMTELVRFGIPKHEYADIYYRWWEE